MSLKSVTGVYESAKRIYFDDSSKFILMSDCHRGDGGMSDSFSKNQNIFFAALTYYYTHNYTYIELGDGDELWENKHMQDIINEHSDIFWLLKKFYRRKKLYMIYGNHDMVKKDLKYVRKNLFQQFSEREENYIPLFENLTIHEGLVLKHKDTGMEILLIHGHQVDFLNSRIWRLARFLVRYFWRPLESFGVNDVTRTAKNYKKKNSVAKKLTQWAMNKKKILIAGHNHKPMFPNEKEPPYFNDGSCVHPRCITGIEISEGKIMLIKWSIKSNGLRQLYIGRDILAGPRKLTDVWQSF